MLTVDYYLSQPVPQVLLGSFDAATTLRAVDPGLDGLPNAGDGGYHKRSVTDSLTVPVVAG